MSNSYSLNAKELHPAIREVLAKRNLTTEEDIAHHFHPESALLKASIQHEALEKARTRIGQAIQKEEPILVFGDYDVDGSCGTAMMVKGILRAGGKVRYFIPDRTKDGYGLNISQVREACKKGYRLMITVDCGIRNSAEIAEAIDRGMDTIVVDHHVLGEDIPKANIIVHPSIISLPTPLRFLCGTALSFLVIRPYLTEEDAHSFAPLLSMATVTDMVTLLGENRALVMNAATYFRHSTLPGIQALYQLAGCHEKMDTRFMMAFILGPRINAAGRVGRSQDAVELFLTEESEEAWRLAKKLNLNNQQRQQIQQRVYSEASKLAKEKRNLPFLLLYKEGWHLGVLGIVAAKIAKEWRKPCLMATKAEGDLYKGSGRSIPGVPLLPLLERCATCFERFGGHALAVGFSLSEETLQKAEAELCQAIEESPKQLSLPIDAKVAIASLNDRFFEQYALLPPFGPGYAKPYFYSKEEVELAKGVVRIDDNNFFYCTLRDGDAKQRGRIHFTIHNTRPRHLVIEKVL